MPKKAKIGSMDDLRLGDVMVCYRPFYEGRFLVVHKTDHGTGRRLDRIAYVTSYVTCVRLSTDSGASDAAAAELGQTRKMYAADVAFAIKNGWLLVELP